VQFQLSETLTDLSETSALRVGFLHSSMYLWNGSFFKEYITASLELCMIQYKYEAMLQVVV
jgi:hypothetical protein